MPTTYEELFARGKGEIPPMQERNTHIAGEERAVRTEAERNTQSMQIPSPTPPPCGEKKKYIWKEKQKHAESQKLLPCSRWNICVNGLSSRIRLQNETDRRVREIPTSEMPVVVLWPWVWKIGQKYSTDFLCCGWDISLSQRKWTEKIEKVQKEIERKQEKRRKIQLKKQQQLQMKLRLTGFNYDIWSYCKESFALQFCFLVHPVRKKNKNNQETVTNTHTKMKRKKERIWKSHNSCSTQVHDFCSTELSDSMCLWSVTMIIFSFSQTTYRTILCCASMFSFCKSWISLWNR